MNLKIFLRPALTIVFGFIGAIIARSGTPPQIFAITGDYFLIIAFITFALLGFILPDILELAGKAGIAALARQIANYLPSPSAPRLNVPRIPFRKRNKQYANPLIIDTSALIDGRLADIVKTGFISGTFLIIPSVIGELHELADSANENKRARGRRGLDCLSSIQKEKKVKVAVLNSQPKDKEVDDKLVKLAKQVRGKLVTVDYNLNKVARIKNVWTLNVNELANAVKTAVLPDEQLLVHITTVGKGKDQGVGYLEDGTMVVVEGGAGLKGKKVNVSVHRVLQTAAGKMIFARSAK